MEFSIKNVIPKPVRASAGAGVLPVGRFTVCGEFGAEAGLFRGRWDGLLAGTGIFPQVEAKMTCVKDASLAAEGYRLAVTPGGVTIAASTGAGARRGLCVVEQLAVSALIEAEERGCAPAIPCGEAAGEPRFIWRGYMLDCSRHFFTVPFIKKMLDGISLCGINVFHWHLSDDQGWRFPVKGWPKLTETGSRRRETLFDNEEYGGFYTEEDIRGLVAYAAARHIEVIPEVDLPGHTSAVLASYPELGCTGGPYRVEDRYGIFEDCLCAGNGRIFGFIADVFDTLAGLFPSPWVHIGGDEVLYDRWAACPVCRAKMKELKLASPSALQSRITSRMAAMLAERGKKAVGWDEILDDSPAFPLPENAAVMSWRGRAGGLAAVQKGRQVIMTPNTEGCYIDYKHRDDPEEPGNLGVSKVSAIYGMEPVSPEMSAAQAALVLGGQANLWTEKVLCGRIAEYMTFPRVCALAEGLWLPPEQKDYAGFLRRLAAHQKRLDFLGYQQYKGVME